MTDVTELARLLRDVADGRPPVPNGTVTVLPTQSEGRVDAVLGFFAHHIVVADVDPSDVHAALDQEDIGAALKPPFLTWLAARVEAAAGCIDVVLVGRATGSPPLQLVPRADLAQHPRVARAFAYRGDVRVLADDGERGVVMLGRGLGGRLELSFEVDLAHRRQGLGLALAAAALHAAPAGEPVWAQVAPGNAASLRLLLAAGFRPVGSEVLFLRQRKLVGAARLPDQAVGPR